MQKLGGEATQAVGDAVSSHTAEGPRRSSHRRGTRPLPWTSQYGYTHTARLLCQKRCSDGLCPAHGAEPPHWEWSRRERDSACRQPPVKRPRYLLVQSQCGGDPDATCLLQGGTMEHIETDGQFAPFPLGGITGKTGMRLMCPRLPDGTGCGPPGSDPRHSERASVAALGTCAMPGRRPARRRHRHPSVPERPPSARFPGLGRRVRGQRRTPRMSSWLPWSLHGCKPRVHAAIVQNWRDLQEQTWYPDPWGTSLVACFSTLSNALYQMVTQLDTAQYPSG